MQNIWSVDTNFCSFSLDFQLQMDPLEKRKLLTVKLLELLEQVSSQEDRYGLQEELFTHIGKDGVKVMRIVWHQ